MSEFLVPEYRVRLFLSVDLTGSTAFKSKTSSFEWLKAFQHFYGEFPPIFSDQFNEVCGSIDSICGLEKTEAPKIWKTIGDEILFVNRVNSITHLGAYVTAFSRSLHKFGEQVQRFSGLNTKGNGWVAAFPSPNCSIGVSSVGEKDPLSGLDDLRTEDFEGKVDKNPRNYDFLGKGIDGGFRISRNSTINAFTISPALAFLLTKAKGNPDATKFEADFVFHEPQEFKGVLNGMPYPVISLDTIRSQKERDLHLLEAELLQKPNIVQKCEVLKTYLEKYIELHDIEKPTLKLSASNADLQEPEHYRLYASQWKAEKAKNDEDMESLSKDGDSKFDSELPSAVEMAKKLN